MSPMSTLPKPESHEDGWWHIWDDPRLTVYEKAVAQAIYRRQFRGHAVLLTRSSIAQLASTSRSQVIRCEQSLRDYGLLRWSRTKQKEVFSYQVLRLQGDLFRTKGVAQVEGSPVKGALPTQSLGHKDGRMHNAVDTNAITARPAGAGPATPSARNDLPPPLTYQVQIETEHLTNSKDKTRAEVRPRGTPAPSKRKQDESEQRRIVAARDRRRTIEEAARREAKVGSGPVASDYGTQIKPEAVARYLARQQG
jgi:hypothetical protein